MKNRVQMLQANLSRRQTVATLTRYSTKFLNLMFGGLMMVVLWGMIYTFAILFSV